jgi:hypothetical protein
MPNLSANLRSAQLSNLSLLAANSLRPTEEAYVGHSVRSKTATKS